MARPVDVQADGYVSQQPCAVKAVVIAAKGATAGDIVVLKNGDSQGTTFLYAIVGAANGTQVINLPDEGLQFPTSCYYSEIAAAAGKIRTTVIL